MAKKLLNTSWRAATGKNPPENPADPDVDVWEAVLWAAVSGTIVGLARMLAQRKAASYYHPLRRPPAAPAREGRPRPGHQPPDDDADWSVADRGA